MTATTAESKDTTIQSLADERDANFRIGLIALIPYMRAFAHTLCRNPDLASDVTQDALVKAWQARNSFQPGTNLKAWLFVILRNAYYSIQRRSKRQADWSNVTDDMLARAGAQQASAELTDLRRAMETLADEQREALILVSAGGFSYEEAASICGCAVGTIKSRVSRARAVIVSLMNGDNGNLPPRRKDTRSPQTLFASELETSFQQRVGSSRRDMGETTSLAV